MSYVKRKLCRSITALKISMAVNKINAKIGRLNYRKPQMLGCGLTSEISDLKYFGASGSFLMTYLNGAICFFNCT